MDERAKKTLVIVVGVVLFGAVIAWRSYMALEPEGGDTNWDAMLVKHLVARGPLGVPRVRILSFRSPPPNAIKLGTLRMPSRLSIARSVQHSTRVYLPVLRAVEAAGGNALVHGPIDQDDPNLRLGWAYLQDTAYFVYAGPLSATWHQRLGHLACMVEGTTGTYTTAGLKTGDLVVDLNHISRHRGWRDQPPGCAVTHRFPRLPHGQPVVLTVLRQGQPLDITVLRDGVSVFYSDPVPVLTDAQIAALDHSGDLAAPDPDAETPQAN